MFFELHKLFNSLKRYYFDDYMKHISTNNGIYILFEKGEKFNEFDRVTRIGSHPVNNRFIKRISDHFTNNQRNSIMRKHIGRCFLNQSNDKYIVIWNYTNSDIKKGSDKFKLVDFEKELIVEKRISEYISKNFSFCIIPDIQKIEIRLRFEKGLIATFNQANQKPISKNWLGNQHPNERIKYSGLWNIHGLAGMKLSNEEYNFIRHSVKNEIK